MKVKCTKCGKVVQRTKEAIQKAAAKAGYASLESYLKDYICGECRGEPVPSKSKNDKRIQFDKVKTRSFEDDIEQGKDREEEEEEEEIDQSFEIEDEIEEDTSEIDELEEELDRLIDEEDEEEEVEL